jgi:hypothetical protein
LIIGENRASKWFRSVAGNYLLRAAMEALARKHKFSHARLVDNVKLLSQVLAFDVANAMTLHREAAERRAHERRQIIDAAIADFGAAIGAVLEAIKSASSQLTTTCTAMRELANNSLKRMELASRCLPASPEHWPHRHRLCLARGL